ncbi:MAG: GNAT family N-acetyltransferase [Chloroflexi bacterium]|nr:GNAT family N-acetyltransferase [Chloroflexota bacterium]MCI0645920.1 GNAT family N-acetyltransferase [Chloroflexota bacterium]MCI0730538.1 GNAT family N-acetyltransferase [Chloroflexota bacterium]
MRRITVQEVTQANWRDTLRLAAHPERQRFLAEYTPVAAIALAKAYIRPGGMLWRPYAIYADDTMIGFIELACFPESRDQYWIYHFFIDHRQQGKGYGKIALQAFIQLVKETHPHCEQVCLAVHPENTRAQHLYTSLGFQQTGEKLYDEPIFRIAL